jgi:RNA polymerase sigma factor (sigma-70 family)
VTTDADEILPVGPAGTLPEPLSSADLISLFGRQREAMVRLACVLTGYPAVAEEVVQEAFLKIHQLDQAPRNPDGYLRTVVANLSKSYLRRLRLERNQSARERLLFDDPVIDETWEVVCRLPFRQRAVLALRFYEDLPEAEIARVLHCRPGTVKSSLHRGLAKLREELS